MEHSVKTGSKSDWKKFRAEHQERVTSCMCLYVCRTKVPPPPPHPTFPPTPKIITRSFVDNVVKRFKHLATCQLSCNVTTSSKCAIFDKLQEKIRSIASRPAQKVTGTRENSEHSVKTGSKSDWNKFRAELATSQHLLNVPSLTSYKRKFGA